MVCAINLGMLAQQRTFTSMEKAYFVALIVLWDPRIVIW